MSSNQIGMQYDTSSIYKSADRLYMSYNISKLGQVEHVVKIFIVPYRHMVPGKHISK